MSTPRYYGLPRGVKVTTGSNGMATVTWPRPFLTAPTVACTVENASTTQGAFADVLAGSVTTAGCTIRAWRLQVIPALISVLGANPALAYAGAVVHVNARGDLA